MNTHPRAMDYPESMLDAPIPDESELTASVQIRAGKRYGFDVDVDKLITRRGGMVIGRDLGQCDIGLGHATVSRRHARLVFADGALRIEDLGSTNRTAIDGVALEAGKRKRLETGAVVKMGEVELKLGGE